MKIHESKFLNKLGEVGFDIMHFYRTFADQFVNRHKLYIENG